jgi:Tetratricopeptide repeat
VSRATAFFVLALVVPLSIGQIAVPAPSLVERPDEITQATVLAIQKWVTAVQDHVPGQRDAPVEMVSALTFDDRLQMNAGMGFFLSFLKGKPEVIKTVPEERLAHLAGAAMAIRGAKAFLKRAAVLHTDTAFKRELDVPARDRAVKGNVKSDGPAVPDEDDTNGEAERLFRRALRADPSYVEARVRLGRLLGVRKHHAEAASELATAIAAKPTGSLLFYANLFAGRSAQALGKIADAAAHYKAASLLFPGAQSAELARSQAALLESDVPAVLDSIQRLDKSTTAQDPWWRYHLASGRDVDVLLREMWSQVAK